MTGYTIGLALSGGGFRATAFHLGTLKRLEELNLLSKIRVVSTVSGGSITGVLYALRCAQRGDGPPGSYPVDELIAELRPFLGCNFRGRAHFGNPLRALRTSASFIIPGVRRTPLLVKELDRSLFKGARLDRLPDWIAINATNLSTGRSWRFHHDRVGDYFVGATDKTHDIMIAEAVMASAAFPGLTDPYPFHGRWEDFRHELLDFRWSQPAEAETRWRNRYGKNEGPVVFPLVDGGVYDNQGMNSLRAFNVSHAIVSSAEQAWSGYKTGLLFRSLARTVSVIHGRLGWMTRQWTHESTHEVHPNKARDSLLEIADSLAELRARVGQEFDREISELERRVSFNAAVGWPPRGRQFSATAQSVLGSLKVARNWSKHFEDPYDIPIEDRGLSVELIEELSRVRTDLDAFEDEIIDALIAQGYFLADAYTKVGMPELIADALEIEEPHAVRPEWSFAHQTVQRSCDRSEGTSTILSSAQKRLFWGRAGNVSEMLRILWGSAVILIFILVFALGSFWLLCSLVSP